ncbi:hypothetical protein O181_026710 [Austropuccinia psidii MF-1]|uniref:Uncharacterized protein n=1 Tax=Austropuccinia psidii MF-1 TaxID=1389203 RepID=A0A9Q3CPX5_9BASI|nr:hypothetical protein [Austropuccinia psidii MF-1]
MRPKGGSPLALKARCVPNHNWTHLSPILATITMTPRNGHKPPWAPNWPRTTKNHFSAHGLWWLPEAIRSAQLNPSPQLKGDSSHSSMHPILKVAGVVHIWYYIPLCTIFSQKFNS